MIVRKIDGSGDWKFGAGLQSYAIDDEAIRQNVRSNILSWTNDCFFALQDGVDWRGRMETSDTKGLADEVRSAILQSFGVVGCTVILAEFDSATRTLRLQYSIDTIFGSSFTEFINQASGE